jgi:nucleoside-diphosphate-sugar epimerase
MRILVAGASGFIGAALCDALIKDGHEVLGLCGSNFKKSLQKKERFQWAIYKFGDSLPDEAIEFDPEIIINLVWKGIPNFSYKICIENLNDQLAFIEETKKLTSVKKIIGAGTCKEYATSHGPCVETDRLAPDNYFSWAKQVVADYLRLSCEERSIKWVWLRIFYVYGPGQRPDSLIPTLIKAIRCGETPNIKNPEAANDFIYLDDVLSVFQLAVKDQEIQGIFNAGSGKLSSVSNIAEIVKKIMMNDESLLGSLNENGDEVNSARGIWANVDKIGKYLKWKANFSLQKGLIETCKKIKLR